jgi:hypothetical protein
MTSDRSATARRLVWMLGLLLLGIGVVLGSASPVWAAAPRPLLAEKHQSGGLACDACHQETPPKAAAPMATCLACHGGTYEKLAEKTQATKPKNPHESHEGEVECEACHHAHKPSEDYCAQCHQFGFRTP